MSRYRHIVFDIDGTLIDTEHAVLYSLRDTLAEQGLTYRIDELTFALGIPGADTLRRLNVDDVLGTRARWFELIAAYHDSIALFDGIDELTRALVDRGLELGIVTSKIRVRYHEDFDHLGIAERFGCVVCAEDTETHKPEPGTLLKYLELTGADPVETLYVGDSPYDAACAHGAGLDFALAVWGHRARDIAAEHYLDNPCNLLDVL